MLRERKKRGGGGELWKEREKKEREDIYLFNE